jgi:3-oxoacyl-[acyl-carrier-protein] synthase II
VDRRVAITGMGVVSPLGMGTDTLFERWLQGEVGIDSDALRAECRDFDPGDALSRKDLRLLNRYCQFAMTAAHEAQRQAGWIERLPTHEEGIACIVGSCHAGHATIERETEKLTQPGRDRVDALVGPMMLPDAAAAAVSIRYGLKGPSCCVATACAAGADAIATAVRMIRSGEADAAVAGGADASITRLTQAGMRRLGATSMSGISRPFDIRRDGFVPAEGAGIVALEEMSVAEARGAEVLAEILACGTTTDAYNVSAPAPDGAQAARAMKLALRGAQVESGDVAYINAHGTSTPLNDKVETLAIKTALGEAASHIPISSTKSVIGHTLGAAGAIELITAVQALRRGWIPPTVGLEQQDPELDLDYVPGEARRIAASPSGNGNGDGLIALSNSFGFGGHNSVLCVRAAMT